MSQTRRGGYWCEMCERMVRGERNSLFGRNLALVLLAPFTLGITLLFVKIDWKYYCPYCGFRVKQPSVIGPRRHPS